MRTNLKIATILSSLLIGFIMWWKFIDITDWIWTWLENHHIYIGWSLNRTLYSISFGLIPILGYIGVLISKDHKLISLLFHTINVFLGVVGTFILGYLFAKSYGKPESPLLPDYITYSPFSGYWNVIPFLGLTFYLGIFTIWKLLKNK